MKLSEELRNKQSRDNRDLLDRAADRIDELEGLATALLRTIGCFATELQPLAKKAVIMFGLSQQEGAQ